MHSVTGKPCGGADHGVGDAGISAGGIEQDFAGAEFSAGAGLGDDVRGGAVFHRSAGVVPLGFAQQLDSGQIASETFQAQQRSVADEFEAAPAERMTRPGRGSARHVQWSKNQALPLVWLRLAAWICD